MIKFIAGVIVGFVAACVIAAKRVRISEATLLQLRRHRQDYPHD